mgnify:CR=1 FL=1
MWLSGVVLLLVFLVADVAVDIVIVLPLMGMGKLLFNVIVGSWCFCSSLSLLILILVLVPMDSFFKMLEAWCSPPLTNM